MDLADYHFVGSCGHLANKKSHIDHYNLLNTPGWINFTQVKLAQHILTGTEVAVKVIRVSRASLTSRDFCMKTNE